jgi:hypothetical protein
MAWEEEPVQRASMAIADTNHRDHIKEHSVELVDSVKMMELKSEELLEKGAELTTRQTEDIAERIDEEIHLLQYKLDHCRRLLQGSESDTLNAEVNIIIYYIRLYYIRLYYIQLHPD